MSPEEWAFKISELIKEAEADDFEIWWDARTEDLVIARWDDKDPGYYKTPIRW